MLEQKLKGILVESEEVAAQYISAKVKSYIYISKQMLTLSVLLNPQLCIPQQSCERL